MTLTVTQNEQKQTQLVNAVLWYAKITRKDNIFIILCRSEKVAQPEYVSSIIQTMKSQYADSPEIMVDAIGYKACYILSRL